MRVCILTNTCDIVHLSYITALCITRLNSNNTKKHVYAGEVRVPYGVSADTLPVIAVCKRLYIE